MLRDFDSVSTERQERSVAGTVFSNGQPRLIQVKGINMEAELTEHMLYITNRDKPGVIGDIGTSTAERGINIANMHLGRDAQNGNAMVLIEIDEKLGFEDLEHLRSRPNITNVQYLHFPALQ